MADEELPKEEHVPANKKLTIFVIDGSEEMFEGGNDCAFRRGLKVVFDQMLGVCCSGSLSQMIGVVVSNTMASKNRANHKFSYEWVPLSFPGSEEVSELKAMLDSDDIHASFIEKFEGHAKCNLTHVMWGCRKIMQLSGTASRHHMMMYFTNNPYPFEDDASFEKFQKLMADFTCTSYRDRNGLRKVVKTPGEFHVAMLCDELSDEDRKKLEQMTSHVFHGGIEALETQAYKKTFSQRAFSLVNLELAPGVKLGVGVYLLAGETRPPTRILLDAETEMQVQRKTTYVAKDTEDDASEGDSSANDTQALEKIERERGKLKKIIKIGGQSIVSDQKELADLSRFDAKGIVLLGFKPIAEIDLTTHTQSAQLLYPDDTNIRGSVNLYRALHARCAARGMAMICRFCSRSNQKIRLVALIPQKKMSDEEMVPEIVDIADKKQRQKTLDELRLANEYRHNAFVVVFLPFAEDLRDLSDQAECPSGGEWPKPSGEDVEVGSQFIRNLTKSYTPESYFNPRLRSFNAMLIEAAVGETVSREDSIQPYFKSRRFEFSEKLKDSLVEHFGVAEDDQPTGTKRTAGASGGETGKRAKTDLTSMSTEEIAQQGLLEKLTVAQLRAAIAESCVGKPPQGAKKADLVAMIAQHFA